MDYPVIRLKTGRERSLFYKHPWIFSGALEASSLRGTGDGEITDVRDSGGNFLARGYYNSQSNIAVRVLTFDEDDIIDAGFFERRLAAAREWRKRFLESDLTDAYRVVFAEGDMLPGLVVDKYGDFLVVQFHTLGMDRLKSQVVDALVKVFGPATIVERSDVAARRQDGLNDMPVGILYGKQPEGPVKIRENGLSFWADLTGGQKTGFFLDQRENRKEIMKYVRDKSVLNLFSYSGGFSVYALAGGAGHVTSVDVSGDAIDLCRKNLMLNGFSAERFETATMDVFDFLEKAAAEKKRYDVVIVDPPAFVKSQKNIDKALKAYSQLNQMALAVLNAGGILISSSCSHFIDGEMFKKSLFQAALKAGKDLRVIEQKGQPFDHPVRLFFPEGQYLKFFVLG